MPQNQLTRKEKILIAEYQAVNNFAVLESGAVWRRFELFILLNAILMAAAVALIIEVVQDEADSILLIKIALLAVAFIGLLVAIGWILINERSTAYRNFWFQRLRDIEFQLKEAKTFTYGRELAEERCLVYHINGDPIKMRFPSKITRTKSILLPLMYIIGAMWLVVLIYAIVRLIR
jgi:hypothetical protein